MSEKMICMSEKDLRILLANMGAYLGDPYIQKVKPVYPSYIVEKINLIIQGASYDTPINPFLNRDLDKTLLGFRNQLLQFMNIPIEIE